MATVSILNVFARRLYALRKVAALVNCFRPFNNAL